MMMVAIIALTACNGNKFHIDGNIEGASDTTLVLEKSSNGEWYIIDSVKVDGKGNFSVSPEAPEVPSIYQLRLGDQSICFPIDSLDKLKIVSKLPNFSSDYTINKYINGKPLFDPMNDNDLRIIGAVANSFNSFRPNDPRTDYLVKLLLEGQRRRHSIAATDTVYADVASIIDIKLQDYNGKEYSLTKVAAENRVVLLDFTAYGTEVSPQLNKLLNDIYQSYHSRGLEIYQIGLDQNNVTWREAAKNLPWITVFDPMNINSQNVGTYNVTGIPTTFIIRGGEIVERVEDATMLKAAVAKYF